MRVPTAADSLRIKVADSALQGDQPALAWPSVGRYRGACPITVDYTGPMPGLAAVWRDWRIEPADSLIQALRDQFGRDNVFFHYR